MDSRILIPLLLVLAPLLLLGVVARLARWRTRGPNRRSPLTKDLLRGPAHSLRVQLDDLRWDFASYLAAAVAAPLLFYALYLQNELAGRALASSMIVIYVGLAAALALMVVVKTVRTIQVGYRLQLGIEAEIATAEELNRLMQLGFWVFHDCPGDKQFNIDHVVVGPTGVFAVETKGRAKRSGRGVSDGHIVRYDGQVLRFPGWSETAVLKQAHRNAKWLQRWLTSAVGEFIAVRPIVVLPGWYVDSANPGTIPVLNEKQAANYCGRPGNSQLSGKQIRQIAHQLDQRCRDIEPQALASPK